MSVTVNDPILAPSQITAVGVAAWYLREFDRAVSRTVWEYLRELERLCELVGFDMLLLAAQSSHETDNWQSVWWTGRRNPAGIGITGDPEQNNASQIWANGTDAARGHVTHMALYVYGDWDEMHMLAFAQPTAGEPWVTLTRELGDAGDYHRYTDILEAGYLNSVRTLNDLTGRWATDPRYAEKIAARANDMIRGMEVEPVTTPTIYNLATDYARYGLTQAEANEIIGSRFENRSQGGVTVSRPEFIVLHIQAGYTKGSLKYWSSPAVDASSTVMIQHDGSVLNIIPEQHAPWTNGDDANPSANGQRLVGLPGNSNLYTLSIEAEGVDGTDTTPAQLDSIVWQVETWMAKYGIPKANVLRHADINSVTRPNCPGAYYPIVMARIGATPVKPKPSVPWPRDEVGPCTINGRIALAFLGEVTAKRDVPIRYSASAKSEVFARMKIGERATIRGSYRAENGTRWAFVEINGGVGRCLLSALTGPWPVL